MGIATGVNKRVRYKLETTNNVAAGGTGGQALRRKQSQIELTKDTYSSEEIRDDFQKGDFRHGVRKIGGTISCELSPKTYADFFAAAVRQHFAAGPTTGSQTTISAVAATGFARSAGDFTTDGFKVGQVVRASGMTAAGNNARNFLITALTATTMNGLFLDGGAAVAVSAAGASTTIAAVGKVAYVPATGQLDDSFTIEHWYSDIAQSEQFIGCRISKVDVKLPSTGMATADFGVTGKDMVTGSSAYFASPAAQTTTGVLAAVNGAVFVGSTQVGLITSLDLSINGNHTTDAVVGSNTTPDVFEGTVDVSGTMSIYFQDATFRDMFLNETEASIVAAFTTANSGTADFIAFTLPRVKLGSATKSDGQKGIVMSASFTALRPVSAPSGTYDTTIAIQDSAA